MMNWIRKIMSDNGEAHTQAAMEAKDPMDWRLTPNSSEWTTEPHWCPTCKKALSHREFMSDVCNRCGGFFEILQLRPRSYRKIWNGEKWVWQYKTGNGPEDYELVDERW